MLEQLHHYSNVGSQKLQWTRMGLYDLSTIFGFLLLQLPPDFMLWNTPSTPISVTCFMNSLKN